MPNTHEENQPAATVTAADVKAATVEAAPPHAGPDQEQDVDLDDLEFLLEEIENRIAPLA